MFWELDLNPSQGATTTSLISEMSEVVLILVAKSESIMARNEFEDRKNAVQGDTREKEHREQEGCHGL